MAGKKKGSKRQRRKRKLILFIVEIIVLALLAGMLIIYHKFDLIQSASVDQTKVRTNDMSDEAQKVFEGYTTIAMFGLDNRTQGVYERGNSDMIMLLNINNDTKEVNVVSVYRDTYLNVAAADEEAKFRKANSAYAYGGPEQAITMLNRNLDLDIDNYVAFDFSAVAEAIDILGGVEIEIEDEEELTQLNKYIKHTNGILDTDAETIDSVGEHTLDGVQSVAYSRIRYTKGDDYKRAERQRRVFSEMVKKAKKANLRQLNSLVNTIFPKIETDLARNDIITMITAMIGYDMADSCGFPFERNSATIGSIGSVVVPCDLSTNVKELHELLFEAAEYEPTDTIEEYNSAIINNTGMTSESGIKDQFSEKDDFDGSDSSDSADGQTDSED